MKKNSIDPQREELLTSLQIRCRQAKTNYEIARHDVMLPGITFIPMEKDILIEYSNGAEERQMLHVAIANDNQQKLLNAAITYGEELKELISAFDAEIFPLYVKYLLNEVEFTKNTIRGIKESN